MLPISNTVLFCTGAKINVETEETQETALTLACCGGFLECCELLIQAGADLELGCSTPLMEAAQEGQVEVVKFLLQRGNRKSLVEIHILVIICAQTNILLKPRNDF